MTERLSMQRQFAYLKKQLLHHLHWYLYWMINLADNDDF